MRHGIRAKGVYQQAHFVATPFAACGAFETFFSLQIMTLLVLPKGFAIGRNVTAN